VEWRAEVKTLLENGDEQVGGDGDPYSSLYGVGSGAIVGVNRVSIVQP